MKRVGAGVLVAVVVAALIGQFYLDGFTPGLEGWGPRLWSMLRYFTILTNGLVAFVMWAEWRGRSLGANWQAMAVLNIVLVGVIFQILLAPEVPYQGLNWWTDLAFHTLVPIGTFAWWLAWGRRDLRLTKIYLWLIWPLAYCVYVLIRGEVDGKYPYFFLDIAKFGAAQVAQNILGLVLVFALTGLGLAFLSRLLDRISLR